METIVNVVTLCFILSFFALMGLVIKAQFSASVEPKEEKKEDLSEKAEEHYAAVVKARK